MCGISGILHKEAANYIETFSEAIAHRGPDGKGSFIGEDVALAHRRLAIQDLSPKGAQPMYSRDQKYVIVFNGEIYNHWELRKEFGKDIEYTSTSDTETLLYGYIAYGPKIVSKLNGIFAFAILEIETGELFIARDHFGVKPLYYYQQDQTFLFSSEIKSFLSFPYLDTSLNIHALVNYIHFLWSPGYATPFKYVRKLLPGHFITLNTKNPAQFKVTKYYEIPFLGQYVSKSENELIDDLEAKLLLAVKRQLLSDVPVGFFLSGGLDSSLIVAIAKKLHPEARLKCFTIAANISTGKEGFAEDLPYARLVASKLDVDLEIVNADIDILRDFDKMIWHLDEPQADAAPLNVWNICRSAREQGYIVLLGGTGGDDLFSGYRRHQALYYEKFMRWVPGFLLNGMVRITAVLQSSNPTLRRINKLFSGFSTRQRPYNMAQYYSWLPLSVNIALFRDEYQNELQSYDPSSILVSALDQIPQEKSRLNQMLFWDMKFFLPDHNLNYTDKMSMAHGVEVRVPYLDKDLVEFSTTIPPDLKLRGLTTKYLLKKVAERYLPDSVIYRPKTGFGAPVRDWITGGLRDFVTQEFSDAPHTTNNIFNISKVRDLIRRNQNSSIDASYPILALLAIGSWHKQFFQKRNKIEE